MYKILFQNYLDDQDENFYHSLETNGPRKLINNFVNYFMENVESKNGFPTPREDIYNELKEVYSNWRYKFSKN
jgi:hypothetical protein